MRDCKFREGDIVDFDMRKDSRCNTWKTVQCEVLEARWLGFYNLMEINRGPRFPKVSCGHHLVSERCLSFPLNPHID